MGQKTKCTITGRTFEVGDIEIDLRKMLNAEGLPDTAPEVRIRALGAFWPHFHLHQRKCDATGKNIISVYSADCPYPVWDKDHLMRNAQPPSADFSRVRPVFDQMYDLFTKSPIAHNTGVGNENCDYTDDWWYSRNCYLCHSGHKDEDVRYSYRARNCSDCEFVAFCFDCELCVDAVNCRECFNLVYGLNCIGPVSG